MSFPEMRAVFKEEIKKVKIKVEEEFQPDCDDVWYEIQLVYDDEVICSQSFRGGSK